MMKALRGIDAAEPIVINLYFKYVKVEFEIYMSF